MKTFTLQSLKSELNQIRNRGWIETRRKGNDGGVGNTLEDLLEIEENNLQIPDAGEWELKGQRSDTTSLITLFHMEPFPREQNFVSSVLLPNYGWPHKEAGKKYPIDEKSFRQTITIGQRTDRGFTALVNYDCERVEISFDHNYVDTNRHCDWLKRIKKRVGLDELDPKPHWSFENLHRKVRSKLNKTIYTIADRRRVNGIEQFRYSRFFMLEGVCECRLINCMDNGAIQIDFDARTGHNHGTKFRLKQGFYKDLFQHVEEF